MKRGCGKSRPVAPTAGRGAHCRARSVSAQLNLVGANLRPDAEAGRRGRAVAQGPGHPATCRTPGIGKSGRLCLGTGRTRRGPYCPRGNSMIGLFRSFMSRRSREYKDPARALRRSKGGGPGTLCRVLRVLCRSRPQGRKTGRPAGAGADQVRACDQPQDRQGARHRGAPDAACPRRRGNRMMGWMAPLRHQRAKLLSDRISSEWEPSMGEVTTIGLDLAKLVFQVHGVFKCPRSGRRFDLALHIIWPTHASAKPVDDRASRKARKLIFEVRSTFRCTKALCR
jgi:hypothetical protein